MMTVRKHTGFMMVLYVLVFLLLMEWLTPIVTLTATGYKLLFLLFIAASLLMLVLRVPWWISGPLKMLYIFWFIVYVYTDETLFSREGIWAVLTDLQFNAAALLAQEWAATTDIFRTFLFFALLWMAVYLVHYWISFRLSIFLFYLLTVIFVAVLDTFSPYTGNTAIIRIMVIGLMLAGLLHLARWMEQHRVPIRTAAVVSWAVPLFVMVAASTAVALYLPKASPIWPDPVPYLQSYSQGSGIGGNGTGAVGRIGYSQDDSVLGGSFVGDDTVVFRAEMPSGQYWRIESKDVYTSKGWELSEAETDPAFYENGDTVWTDMLTGGTENEQTASVLMEDVRFPFVLYPYGTKSFYMAEPTDYRYNPADQRIGTYRADSTFEPEEYEVLYSEPSYSLSALRETSVDDLAELPSEFDRYLQLPEDLPDRVGELSESITASETSIYDKARAIEQYFSDNQFEYTRQDVPVPEGDQDYVDQFLFETQRGYCDNFSTAMVVMLRSLDIPARWVKGFNEGEEIETSDGRTIYEITNNNAHSWVEAYMPNIGWMVFEPTVSFTNARNIDFDLELEENEEQEDTAPEQLEKPEQQEEVQTEEDSEEDNNFIAGLSKFWTDHQGKFGWGLVLAAAISGLLYYFRRKWLPKVLIPYFRMRRHDAQAFEKAYLQLLKQLTLYGVERREGQTLASYAAYIDGFFGTRDMTKLTKVYERSVYGGNPALTEWEQLIESWEYLINRTSS